MYKILEDENELRRFFDFYLHENWLKPTECLFLSLAARNKYMKDRESSDINLNKTHMFDRQIVTGKDTHRLWNNLITAIRKLERNEGAYKVKSKTDINKLYDIPQECMILYFNVNPANCVNALIQLKDRINLIEQELWKASTNGNSIENCILDISRIHHIAEECYGKAKSKTRWFDVDIDFEYFDIENNELIMNTMKFLSEDLNVDSDNFFAIRTYGGYHLCFKVDICKNKKLSPHQILDKIREKMESDIYEYNNSGRFVNFSGSNPPNEIIPKEIKLNDNGIIPLPGTKQSTRLVKFIQIEKEKSIAEKIFEENKHLFDNYLKNPSCTNEEYFEDMRKKYNQLNEDSYKEAMEKGYLPFEKASKSLANSLGEEPELIRQWMMKEYKKELKRGKNER